MDDPFWQSWKFVVGTICATLLVVWIVARWRFAALVKQREQLVIEVAQQTERIQEQNNALEKANRELYELSIRDPLTGVYNRRYIFEYGNRDLEKRRAERMGYAVVLLDIDHFKHINDRFGHAIGDEVLRMLTRTLGQRHESNGVLGRIGGEEFLILLGPMTAPVALRQAAALQEAVSTLRVPSGDGQVPITVSMGVTVSLSHETLSLEALIHRADQALYRAKQNGRNRIELAVA
jgi:diguanylate cyclase (GGDEF)-like protein